MKKEKWYLLLGAFALALVFAACENPAGPGTETPPGEGLPVVPPVEELPVGPEPETGP
jgi:hypothetical protein